MIAQLNKIKTYPFYGQVILVALPAVILVALFVYLYLIPAGDEMKALADKITKLDKEIMISETKIKKLDTLIAENKVLKAKLVRLQEQLPEEKEVSVLLKQISELGLRAGLEILLWKPQAKKTDPKGLYVEIPVNVEVLAEYHKLGDFFSHISRLPRLVNISDITLQKKDKSGQEALGIINASFTARTFAAASKQDKLQAQQATPRGR